MFLGCQVSLSGWNRGGIKREKGSYLLELLEEVVVVNDYNCGAPQTNAIGVVAGKCRQR